MTSAAFSDDSNSIAFSLHNASPDKPAQLVWISLEADTCSVTHSAFIDRQASTSDSRILAGSAKSYGSNGKANGHANGKANGVPADLGRAALDTSPEVEEEGSSSDQHSDSISEEEKTSSNSVRDIVKLAMSPNKRWLAFGDRNRSLHVYDLQKKQVTPLPLNRMLLILCDSIIALYPHQNTPWQHYLSYLIIPMFLSSAYSTMSCISTMSRDAALRPGRTTLISSRLFNYFNQEMP